MHRDRLPAYYSRLLLAHERNIDIIVQTYDSCLFLVNVTLVCFDTLFAPEVDEAITQILLLRKALVHRAHGIYVVVADSVCISHLGISA